MALFFFWLDGLDVQLLSFSNCYINVLEKIKTSVQWRFIGFYGDPLRVDGHNPWELF